MKILIFTEAGTEIGLGHLTRCSGLYDAAVSSGYDCQLIIYSDFKEIFQLEDINYKIVDWKTIDFIEKYISKKDSCIIDSYLADFNIYNKIAKKANKTIYIDDNARIQYPPNGVIVNPSLYPYHLYNNSVKNALLGSEYIILREPFIKAKRGSINKKVENVLIIMGGTDIKNITELLIKTICRTNTDINFHIISSRITDIKNNNIYIYNNLNAFKMKELMLKCDVAITAAGQTIYELLATKTPFIAVEAIDNQKTNIKGIIVNSLADTIEFKNINDFNKKVKKHFDKIRSFTYRFELSKKYSKMVDGLGSRRIIDYLISI